MSSLAPKGLPRAIEPPRFRDLRVRAKLMVLHNIFFLVMAAAVYYSVFPLVEQQLALEAEALGVPLDDVATQARLRLFATLGVIYVAAVLGLELVIMPRYVYRPIQATLDADDAVQQGKREAELIPATEIPGDEIGDIMRSRNATVRSLREKEAGLELALERLENARQGMAAQDRLATIGLLSASVAHELNTPLSVIRGSMDKLLETVEDPPTRSRLARIRRMTDRLAKISEGLLDFSRVRRAAGDEPVNLRLLINEAWGLLELDDRADQAVFRNEVDAEWRAPGNEDRLLQVFVNLLKNAIYALEGPGEIIVRARREQTPEGEFVAIDVDDSGRGIPEDVLPNIFEAFVSTRLDSKGTGLGLTVAGGIVEQHGGTVSAANRPEGGARLTVRLPLNARARKENVA